MDSHMTRGQMKAEVAEIDAVEAELDACIAECVRIFRSRRISLAEKKRQIQEIAGECLRKMLDSFLS